MGKALKAWEVRVKHWVWDRAASSICVPILSLWKEKHKLKVTVQPVAVRKTKRICSGFMSSASIPATEVKFIKSWGNISASDRHFWGSFYPVTAKAWPTALGYSFRQKAADIMKSFFLQEQITNHFKSRAICSERHYFLLQGWDIF